MLYEEHVLYFDETRKWRERYVVVRANYSLECHESYEVTATRNVCVVPMSQSSSMYGIIHCI